MSRLIIGCGYLGKRVALHWQNDQQLFVTTRSQERAAEFAAVGWQPLVGDITKPESLPTCPTDVRTVLIAVGFDRSNYESADQVYVQGLKNVLTWLPESLERIIYVSSTGVYSQADGSWIDESAPTQPTRDSGKACLAAEQLLQTSKFADRSIILRLAGIYGPDRLPRLKQLAAGEPLGAVAEGWLNLIQVEDAARIIVNAETDVPPPELLLVSDGNPVLRRSFYEELARLTDSPPPVFQVPEQGTTTAARGSTDKRVSNERLIDKLNPAFRFPSYREGLAAIVAKL
jgi:nucleoside-diphosphate-sugar epimerase